MTTWQDANTIETAWGSTDNNVQVIEFIDNEYNINFALVDINGFSIRKWNDSNAIETAWKDA